MATSEANSSIDLLNDDILMRIFDYLHLDDKIRLRVACKRWKCLLDYQVKQIKALRVGLFHQGGYNVTSGLQMKCNSHNNGSSTAMANSKQQYTGTLSNRQVLILPADPTTQCHSINQYDFLHRAMRHCYENLTLLSLGRLNVSYRLLMVIAHNLPKLEHLELINCASELEHLKSNRRRGFGDSPVAKGRHLSELSDNHLPSLASFNCSRSANLVGLYSTHLYNQHDDEQLNLEERLERAKQVKSCELVKESVRRNYWPNLTHLLVKDCNLLNEFSLSLILAVTSQTLEHLMVESNQYLTGEFLNYCGPKLQILRLKYCPLLQLRFLEDLVKLKQLLSPDNKQITINSLSLPLSSSLHLTHNKQDIYCML